MSVTIITEQQIWDALQDVHDPEIPAISVVDLGIIRKVACDGDAVAVEIMPTFIACPAIDIICCDVAARLQQLTAHVDVRVTYEEQWTSERITERGRENLRRAGYAPPSRTTQAIGENVFPLILHPAVECPFCGSRHTRLENAFGPTLCRAIYYCADCRQPFEQFKSV